MNTTEQEKGYNGWKNYETWAVKLWMENDESDYEYWKDVTKSQWNNTQKTTYGTRKENAINNLADYIKEWVIDNNPMNQFDNQASMYHDLMNVALSEIDFYEIAESLLEEYKE